MSIRITGKSRTALVMEQIGREMDAAVARLPHREAVPPFNVYRHYRMRPEHWRSRMIAGDE